MPVIGVNIRNINSERGENVGGNLKVNNTPKIKGVKIKEVGNINKEALSIDFEYTCKYSKEDSDESVAEINIGGEVLFMTDDPQSVVENWEENKDLPEEIVIPTINSVMRKSLTKAIDISESLQVPPPIRFPKAKKKSDSARYIG
ncbi:MAG: hypothetical protein ACLFQ8_02985 [Candidatus Aenigmatarchaeota archaeon]